MMGQGPQFCDSMGNAWTSNWVRASGDIVADLKHNISAEAGAKMAYDRLIHLTDDPGCKETLTYLMTREISHQQMFHAGAREPGQGSRWKARSSPSRTSTPTTTCPATARAMRGIGKDERGPWNAGRPLELRR